MQLQYKPILLTISPSVTRIGIMYSSNIMDLNVFWVSYYIKMSQDVIDTQLKIAGSVTQFILWIYKSLPNKQQVRGPFKYHVTQLWGGRVSLFVTFGR